MTSMRRRNRLMERLNIYFQSDKLPGMNSLDPICRERRSAVIDRRKCHTYLANDRRSGLTDRRKRLPYIPDLVDVLRRKRRSQI